MKQAIKIKQVIKKIVSRFGVEIKKYSTNDLVWKEISLKPKNASKGNVLLSYRIEPFLLKEDDTEMNSHITNWDCLLIAKTFLDLGYCVDVISWLNKRFVPKKNYAFFIDEIGRAHV